MPHITILKTGRKYHDVDSQTASLFVEAGLAEYFKPVQIGGGEKPLPKENTFTVLQNHLTAKWEIVLTTPAGGVARFNGAPAQARDAFKAMAWSPSEQKQVLTGPEPSAEIIEAYEKAMRHEAAVRVATATAIRDGENKIASRKMF